MHASMRAVRRCMLKSVCTCSALSTSRGSLCGPLSVSSVRTTQCSFMKASRKACDRGKGVTQE